MEWRNRRVDGEWRRVNKNLNAGDGVRRMKERKKERERSRRKYGKKDEKGRWRNGYKYTQILKMLNVNTTT